MEQADKPLGFRPGRAPRLTVGQLLEVVLCGATVLPSILLYDRYFSGLGFLRPLGAALIAGLALALGARLMARLTRQRWWWNLLAGSAGGAAMEIYFLLRGTLFDGLPTKATLLAIGQGLLGGWARLLSADVPLVANAAVLITPLLATWLAAYLSATLAVRTRSPVAPLLPGLCAFVLALFIVENVTGTHLRLAAGFLAAAAALAYARATDRGTLRGLEVEIPAERPAGRSQSARAVSLLRAGGTRGLGGLVVSLLIVLTSWVATGATASTVQTRHFDARTLIHVPVNVDQALNPLLLVRPQLQQKPAVHLFTATVSIAGPTPATRTSTAGSDLDTPFNEIRIAALDRFDGAQWTSAASFDAFSEQLPAMTALNAPDTITTQITVTGLTGPFLPVIGQPTHISVTHEVGQIGFDADSGSLANAASTLTGLRYTVAGQIQPADAAIDTASTGSGSAFADDIALPSGTPTGLETLARRITANSTTAYGKLTEMAAYLRQYPYSLDAPPGESYRAVASMLDGTAPSGQLGYDEQHASAFAILARALGYPSRIAVGYVLGSAHQSNYQVTTADARAWAEVFFYGYGWVPFEPSDATHHADTVPQQNQAPGKIAFIPPSVRPHVVPPPSQLPVPRAAPGPGTGTALRTTAYVLGGLIVLDIQIELAIAAEKLRRRLRRRYRGSPAMRILGAWHETTDRLVEVGAAAPISASPSQAAAFSASRRRMSQPAAAALNELARLVTRVVFAGTASFSQADIQRAWHLARLVQRGIYRTRWHPGHLYRWLDPRPLLRPWRIRRKMAKMGITLAGDMK